MTHRSTLFPIRYLVSILLAALLCGAQSTTADEVTSPVYVASSGANRPTLGIPRWKGYMHPSNPDHFWVSYASQSSTASELSVTTDGGQTWSSDPIKITNTGYMDFHLSLFGYNGELYFTWPGVDFRKFSSPALSESNRGPLVELAGTEPSYRSNIMVDGTGRIWVFTRDGDNASQNVRYQFSDNSGSTWTRGVGFATGASNVRIGSMPYIDGRPALIVLYLNDPRGYEYYLWNGSQFEARPDHSIFAQNMGYHRSFSHNVVNDTVMHFFFGLGNDLHHLWKNYNNGSGGWNHQIIESSAFTSDMDWSPSSTVRGNNLYLFYSKKSSSSDASSQIYYMKWSQGVASWAQPVQVSGGQSPSYNFDPNTCFRVPLNSPYIPVFWHSGTSNYDIFFAKIMLDDVTPDTTPPATITSLSLSPGAASGALRLQWTAPGDDGMTGQATRYVIKYSAQQITSANWNNAVTFANPPVPAPAGQLQSLTISGLTPGGVYYAAIRALDEVDNISGVSNSPSGFAAGIRVPSISGSTADTSAQQITAIAQQVASYYALQYQFALDTTVPFVQPDVKTGEINGALVSAVFDELSLGTGYFWRVRAVEVGASDSSAWSAVVQVSLGSCCINNRGNIDDDPDDEVDLSDAIYLANYLILGGPPPSCAARANVDGDEAGEVDLSDLIYLANYLFVSGPPPVPCD